MVVIRHGAYRYQTEMGVDLCSSQQAFILNYQFNSQPSDMSFLLQVKKNNICDKRFGFGRMYRSIDTYCIYIMAKDQVFNIQNNANKFLCYLHNNAIRNYTVK